MPTLAPKNTVEQPGVDNPQIHDSTEDNFNNATMATDNNI